MVSANSACCRLRQRLSVCLLIVGLNFASNIARGDESSSNQPKDETASQKSTADTAAKAIAVATHRQAGTIQIAEAGQPQAKVVCYCLTEDGNILAGCVADTGEVRAFDAEGKLTDTWNLPVNPEAICVGKGGSVYIAGEGKLLKLAPTGSVELTKPSPQAAALTEHPEKLREEVIAQAKQRAEQFANQSKVYDKMIEQADKQISSLQERLAAAEEKAEASSSDGNNESAKKDAKASRAQSQAARTKTLIERQIQMYTRQKEQYAQMKTQFAEMLGANPTGELSEEQIEQQVKASMEYKLKASSISANDDDVFLATHAAVGYGFEVWRMNDQLEDATTIIKDLSGCCGQMDVKANKDGVFVAENSQHRVCHFDREGKSLGNWGFGARTGLDGFGSCCNPMNVAFGPGDAVYTAEDDTGRIKRYSEKGKLLGLVGAVELKPGCKNCSIAVSGDGKRVYMLDITRNLIVRLDARPADEVATEVEKMKSAPPAAAPPSEEPSADDAATSADGVGVIVDAVQSIFSR